MLGILGQKLGMTRLISAAGEVIPVTLVQTEQNAITHVKTTEKDGYNALVLGFKQFKHPSKVRKFRFVREFQVEKPEEFKDKPEIGIDAFAEGEIVSIQGISKGKGFQGVVKRHKFKGGPASHGSDHHREPGSMGTRKPRRVKAGKRMPGHMGSDQITLKHVQIVKIDAEKHIIAIKGPLPGSIQSLIRITKVA